ncbi:MAG: phosphatidate cytidylyltransferase [bacterium]|nr:phosphatidate cytidylyltransferase [bacterium]
MLRERIITGMIAIPIITAIIFYSPLLLSVLAWIIVILAMREYYLMVKLPIKFDFIIFTVFSFILCSFALMNTFKYFNIIFLSLLAVIGAIWVLYYNKINKKYFLLASLGNIYITYFFLHLIFLRNIEGLGAKYVFFIFLLVWVTDTSAYFIGVNFGKHKLAPGISPKKTKEGAVAGIIGAVLVTLLAKMTFIPTLALPQCFLIGIIFSIVAQTGDLFESALKRKAGIKDSGNLLPGHGGVLDRFDSLFFTIPIFYYYVKLVLEK